MLEFKIDDTDFGIDVAKSSFGLTRDGRELFVNVSGDRERFKALTSFPESKWSWAIYAPRFYINGFPFERGTDGRLTAHVGVSDLEEYEVAVYMMAHHDVDEVVVELVPGRFGRRKGRICPTRRCDFPSDGPSKTSVSPSRAA